MTFERILLVTIAEVIGVGDQVTGVIATLLGAERRIILATAIAAAVSAVTTVTAFAT